MAMNDGLSRRRFLWGAGAAAAAYTLGACSDDSGSSAATTTGRSATTFATTTSLATTTTTAVRRAGERPDPTKPEGTDMLPQIEHIIVLMMENHSFDNYLGMLGRGDGFTLGPDGKPTAANVDANGVSVPAFHMANTCQLQGQPSQAWNASHTQWDSGAMDGFARSDSGPVSMGYWTGDDIPFYYGLASTFPLCDRWFGSCLGQTFPNRRFLLAGTARGNIRTTNDTLSDPPPPNGTIMEALGRNGIEWRDYYASLPTVGLWLPVLTSNADKVQKTEQFFVDAAAGTLPAFTLVDPDFEEHSEEDPQDISVGEAFAASVVNAVLQSPAWPKTMFIWTYDEHGGYYDHVPPPAAIAPDEVPPKLEPGDVPGGYDQYGMRVPAVIMSPYAKAGYVSHVVHDHTSVLKLIETKFNLPALTDRDANASDLLDSLDFDADPAFLTPPALPAPKSATGARLCDAPGPVPNPAG